MSFILLTVLLIFNYVGPGLAGGFITAVLGIVTAIFLALFAILWYPIKNLISKFKKKKS